MDGGEIILTGEYNQFRSEKRFNTDKASERDISAILVSLSNDIEPYTYQFAGIDTKKIDVLINVEKGLSAAVEFLRTFKRDSLLPAAQNKKTMVPIAENYLLNQLFTRAGVAFKPTDSTSIKPEIEKPEDQILFVGNCKGWFSVKKLSINGKTQDWEVSGILAGINHTLVNKAFDFVGSSGEAVSGGRKSFGNLADALGRTENDPYAITKTCENFNYKPYAAPDMLTEEYPGIKPPRVKGRKPKG